MADEKAGDEDDGMAGDKGADAIGEAIGAEARGAEARGADAIGAEEGTIDCPTGFTRLIIAVAEACPARNILESVLPISEKCT